METTATTTALCGAKTRRGTACAARPEPGKKRCRYHGGMSTGAKTEEGKTRISEAAKRKWAAYRAAKAVEAVEAVEAGTAGSTTPDVSSPTSPIHADRPEGARQNRHNHARRRGRFPA